MTSGSRKESRAPLLIDEEGVSRAYARLILAVADSPGVEVAPLVLSINGFLPDRTTPEDGPLRAEMDALLNSKGRMSVDDVAFTIFPEELWRLAQRNRTRLFEYFRLAWPSYRAMNPRANGRGLYFQRMTMYGRGPCDGNQLEWILGQSARKGVRRSMAQVATFDPGRDHDATAQLGFPCLQQVSFVPASDGLVVNGFYATQQIFDKAYGNYLGLARLGAFMAHEMGIPLARLNVMVGVAKLERIGKTDAAMRPLIAAARQCLAPADCEPAVSLRERVLEPA